MVACWELAWRCASQLRAALGDNRGARLSWAEALLGRVPGLEAGDRRADCHTADLHHRLQCGCLDRADIGARGAGVASDQPHVQPPVRGPGFRVCTGPCGPEPRSMGRSAGHGHGWAGEWKVIQATLWGAGHGQERVGRATELVLEASPMSAATGSSHRLIVAFGGGFWFSQQLL